MVLYARSILDFAIAAARALGRLLPWSGARGLPVTAPSTPWAVSGGAAGEPMEPSPLSASVSLSGQSPRAFVCRTGQCTTPLGRTSTGSPSWTR